MAAGKWISDLTPATPLADAARRVLGIRLEVVRDFLGLALHQPDKDPEHVHQLRVATRRAGAALRIFADCLPPKLHKQARKHLRRLRRAAGAARDWDVFLAGLSAGGRKPPPGQAPGLDFLAGYAVARRADALAGLKQTSPDYPFGFERLLADVLAGVRRPDAGPRTLGGLARPLLGGLLRALHQAAADNLDDYGHLHRVRIVGKRLRYALEVFADCFEPRLREELYPAVEEMQEMLGRANDSHVAAGRLADLGARLRDARPGDRKRFRAGIEGLRHAHEERLPQERKHFLEWWARWKDPLQEAALLGLLKPASGTRRAKAADAGPKAEEAAGAS